MTQVPVALAMIISDAVWTDPGNGKKTILGTFSAIVATSLPVRVPHMAVYLALTDARGKMDLELRLVDVDEQREPVYTEQLDVEFTDPIMILEGVVTLTNVVEFPAAGEYRLQLFCGHELIIERRIIVIPQSEGPK